MRIHSKWNEWDENQKQKYVEKLERTYPEGHPYAVYQGKNKGATSNATPVASEGSLREKFSKIFNSSVFEKMGEVIEDEQLKNDLFQFLKDELGIKKPKGDDLEIESQDRGYLLKIDGQEYLILSEDEAEEEAIDRTENLLEELGIEEAFGENIAEDVMNNCDIVFNSKFEQERFVSESVDSISQYYYDIGSEDESSDEFGEHSRADIEVHARLKEFNLIPDTETMKSLIEKEKEDLKEGFEKNKSFYEERDEEAYKDYDDYVSKCGSDNLEFEYARAKVSNQSIEDVCEKDLESRGGPHQYLKDMFGNGKEAWDLIEKNYSVDKRAIAKYVFNNYGSRANELSTYDGKELSVGNNHYAYRVN